MNILENLLKEQAAQIGLRLDEGQLARFNSFYEFLAAENKKYNLTGICTVDDIVAKHFVDSLLCATLDLLEGRERIVDVGSGAGFPGVPLKILYPGIKLALLEAAKKKAVFLRELVKILGLSGVEVINDRAENAGRNQKFRETFDIAVSRAVAGIPVLAEYCLPFVRPGGYFIALKGPRSDNEMSAGLKAASLLAGELAGTHHLDLPSGKGRRVIILFKKVGFCDKKYPRRPGIPGKRPLFTG